MAIETEEANFVQLVQDLQADQEDAEQWFFQFQQHLALTVQAIHRLNLAFQGRVTGETQ